LIEVALGFDFSVFAFTIMVVLQESLKLKILFANEMNRSSLN